MIVSDDIAVNTSDEDNMKPKFRENSIDGEEEERGTADEPATATPEIQSSNVLSKTPGSDKSPAAGKRRKLENLTQAVTTVSGTKSKYSRQFKQ
ncbi:hypothetical protein FQA39_LY05994 [Lamprigera yunnana]|nr:hypothetical protein FQA39_LY05994 [Lamprigera yunnana]